MLPSPMPCCQRLAKVMKFFLVPQMCCYSLWSVELLSLLPECNIAVSFQGKPTFRSHRQIEHSIALYLLYKITIFNKIPIARQLTSNWM